MVRFALSLVWGVAGLVAVAEPPPLPADLAALPNSAVAVIQTDASAALQTPTIQRFVRLLEKAGPDATEKALAGFVPDLRTIDRVSVAVVLMDPAGRQVREITELLEPVFVFHTSKPFDRTDATTCLIGPDAKKVEAGTQTIYVTRTGDAAMAFPGANTILAGTPAAVALALKTPVRPDSALARELQNPAADGATMTAAVVLTNLPPGVLSGIKPLQPVFAGAETARFTLRQTNDRAAMTLQMQYASAEAAQKADRAMRGLAAEARKQLEQVRNQALQQLAGKPDRLAVRPIDDLPEALTPLFQLALANAADELLADLPIKQTNEVLTATADLPAELAVFTGTPILVGLMLPAVQKVREAAARTTSQNNLKQIGLAMHMHYDVSDSFPPAAIRDQNGKPLLSWRVAILPYIEQEALYKKFKLDESWDSPNNAKLIQEMPKIYADPRAAAVPGHTYYKVFSGKGTLFDGPKGIKFQTITDGTSNTLLTVAGGDPVVWTQPLDFEIDLSQPIPDLYGPFADLLVGMADGSIRVLKIRGMDATDANVLLKALITRSGGEVVEFPK